MSKTFRPRMVVVNNPDDCPFHPADYAGFILSRRCCHKDNSTEKRTPADCRDKLDRICSDTNCPLKVAVCGICMTYVHKPGRGTSRTRRTVAYVWLDTPRLVSRVRTNDGELMIKKTPIDREKRLDELLRLRLL